ncbi:cis-Golgi t-SNARE syntaxin [Chytridiales sp. JEL 0842]|nr:cis-Golgi t-SNARE syntaxin [Chytridiales sp. JEL 0842]
MTVKDRTNEFFAAVDSMLQRGSAAPYHVGGGGQERSRLLDPSSGSTSSKSEFTKAASIISKEINSTVHKLQKLTVLAKKKSLFDDRPVEINELIYIIKQDIAKINNQISTLAKYHAQAKAGVDTSKLLGPKAAAAGGAKNRQVVEHSTNVITSLQSKLATTSNEFKNILEIRTQNMKDQKSRRDQYSFTPAPGASSTSVGPSASPLASAGPLVDISSNPNSAVVAGKSAGPTPLPSNPNSLFSVGTAGQGTSGLVPQGSSPSLFTPTPGTQSSSLYNPERKPGPGSVAGPGFENQLRNRGATAAAGGASGGDVVLDFGGGGAGGPGLNGGGQNQMMMYAGAQGANMEYIESRAQAIESIESTIAELGQIYQHFAQILAGQREMVQRIDDNIVDVEMNVTGAHDQLLKYFQNMSSNRWLMIKVFAVLVVFFLLFVLIT